MSWRRPVGVPVVHLSHSETVHPIAGDAVFLEHHGDGLFRVAGRVALAAAFGGGGGRPLELIGEAEVIHDPTAGFVFEHAVHAGAGLHEAVALHRLVGIHGVQTRLGPEAMGALRQQQRKIGAGMQLPQPPLRLPMQLDPLPLVPNAKSDRTNQQATDRCFASSESQFEQGDFPLLYDFYGPIAGSAPETKE